VIHLVDTANLAASVAKSEPLSNLAPESLATWETSGGTRWILAISNRINAWKIVDHDGRLSLELGWTVEAYPLSIPMIMNGVVFVLSSGVQPTLFAFDGVTGKQLWNSGTTIASYSVEAGALSGGAGQVYLSTNDGTVYAFGFPMEH
jgi:outer membrane protein assembly factor BamB